SDHPPGNSLEFAPGGLIRPRGGHSLPPRLRIRARHRHHTIGRAPFTWFLGPDAGGAAHARPHGAHCAACRKSVARRRLFVSRGKKPSTVPRCHDERPSHCDTWRGSRVFGHTLGEPEPPSSASKSFILHRLYSVLS